MNWKAIFKIQGLLLLLLSVSMIIPLIFSLFYGSDDIDELFYSILITSFSGLILFLLLKSDETLRPREGFVAVAMGWISAAAFGALPFWLWGMSGGNYIDCLFESMSGFTTTGSSILTDIEALPKGILFWRSFTHWLGGMGIIVLIVAILPMLGFNSTQLYKAEAAGPTKDKLSPKIKDTAKILWFIYAGMTVIMTILLLTAGMDLFDALCHTFAALGTGGFSTYNKSVGNFDSLYVEILITAFMYVSAINFFLHYNLIRGNVKGFFRDKEWQFYTTLLLLTGFAIAMNMHFHNYSQEDISKYPEVLKYNSSFFLCLRHSFFTTVSLASSTGYVTANYEMWPYFSKLMLILLMFGGGCAGSTSGGIKQIRLMMVIKIVYNEIKKLTYPRAFFSVKIANDVYSDPIIKSTIAFVILYISTFAVVSLILTFQGYDIITRSGTCKGGSYREFCLF
jgi:trk system potassium uptake protein